MKTRILILLVAFMMVSTVEASISKENPNSKWDYGYYNDEPIHFKERGIKFFIFPDGQMDFDIHPNAQGTTTEYYYKSNRNKSRHGAYHGGVKVVRDYRGRVIRVGRVFINYNYSGKISRVGSVFISYRRNMMTRVGGLRLIYDRHGNVSYVGRVKHHYYNNYYTNYYHDYYQNFYHDYFYDNYVYDFNDDFFDDDNFYNEYEQFNEDDDYYYYRSKRRSSKTRNGKKEVKQKMIKRKKLNTDKSKVTPRKPKKQIRRGTHKW